MCLGAKWGSAVGSPAYQLCALGKLFLGTWVACFALRDVSTQCPVFGQCPRDARLLLFWLVCGSRMLNTWKSAVIHCFLMCWLVCVDFFKSNLYNSWRTDMKDIGENIFKWPNYVEHFCWRWNHCSSIKKKKKIHQKKGGYFREGYQMNEIFPQENSIHTCNPETFNALNSANPPPLFFK